MRKLALAAVIFTAVTPLGAAIAQSGGGLVAPELSKPTPGRLINQDYMTPTGETVPRPGVPQSSGPTPLDRTLQQQDKRIDKSICSNC